MTALPRITPDAVRAAMAKLPEMELVAEDFGDGVTCGCALTFLAVADGTPPPTQTMQEQTIDGGACYMSECVINWAIAKFDAQYVRGFHRGFDRTDFSPRDAREILGYSDGKVCRQALLPGEEHSRAW